MSYAKKMSLEEWTQFLDEVDHNVTEAVGTAVYDAVSTTVEKWATQKPLHAFEDRYGGVISLSDDYGVSVSVSVPDLAKRLGWQPTRTDKPAEAPTGDPTPTDDEITF